MNWSEMMAAGLGQLRLPPDVFWSMTPREFRAALGLGLNRPMTRDALAALAARFPDEEQK